jgi:intermediate filament protein if
MSQTRTTVRTIERGVRCASSHSKSSKERARSSSRVSSRAGSPACDLHVKQQLHAFIDHSNLEKSELGQLNQRFSCYVNQVKQLECENSRLMGDISDLQSHWGDDTRGVRDAYEQNLFDLRTRIDDVANLKTIADVRNKRSSYENCEYQRRLGDTVKLNDGEKQKIKNLEKELCMAVEQNALLKKSIADELCDIEKHRVNRDETWAQLVELLDKLDDELYRRISVEYNNQTLREHIEFVKAVNERELIEMNQMSEALPFNDQIDFYKDQLKRVIGNIRRDYEQLHLEQTRELEEWMRLKSEELTAKATENDALHEMQMGIQLENIESMRNTYDANQKELDELKRHNQLMSQQMEAIEKHTESERASLNETLQMQTAEVSKLGEDMANLLNDYNHINSNKANLEYEMQVYKRLLDSQLERINMPDCSNPSIAPTTTTNKPPPTSQQAACTPCGAPAPKAVCAAVAAAAASSSCVPPSLAGATLEAGKPAGHTCVTSNAFGGKVQNKKEKKGTIGICDSSPDGKFIILENTGTSAACDLSGWVIKRRVDGNGELCYQIPAGICLPPCQELTVWAQSYCQSKGPGDLVADFENWGIGINSVSKLVSCQGEEKSTFHQQITFSNRY